MPSSTSYGAGCDFIIRSIDGTQFRVRRDCLEAGSQVFRDMFACCEPDFVTDMYGDDQALDLTEPSVLLDLLFRFLHSPPESYVADETDEEDADSVASFTRIRVVFPGSAIPLPVLSVLITLADKYALSQPLLQCLYSHLAAHASTSPLRVYGYAIGLGLDSIAAKASMYLLHPPLSEYSPEEVKVIPTADAYHRLLLLHDHRIKALREVLIGESIFPHGYGQCVKHSQTTTALWEQRKRVVAQQLQAATDAAAEMAEVQTKLDACQTCSKACTAALSMLDYKCGKVLKRVDQLAPEVSIGRSS
ncbi:hypothetical protein A0H81_00528 [Grifola frondosa]|uniref:BTB domain-containing protein n=1 Tax=Grifola frondosa TaxID=5627 RepID=A0A1C7MTJ8_GRIFR|nr:hypothetical protein A0H81_00528 [Grifola frondosa]